MAINPRAKGQFVQPGDLVFIPAGLSTPDGTVLFDTVYLQADYPELFALLGITFNSSGKGDNDTTQFRTPIAPSWANDTAWDVHMRF